jgi:hypothetical protein
MGTSNFIFSRAAFPFEVPGLNLPLVVQELQMGGARFRHACDFRRDKGSSRTWFKGFREYRLCTNVQACRPNALDSLLRCAQNRSYTNKAFRAATEAAWAL